MPDTWLDPLLRFIFPFHVPAADRQRKQEEYDRRMEAYEDKLITDYELHRLNEEMVLNGDVPYYDVCEAVGDSHAHLAPATCLPPKSQAELARLFGRGLD